MFFLDHKTSRNSAGVMFAGYIWKELVVYVPTGLSLIPKRYSRLWITAAVCVSGSLV